MLSWESQLCCENIMPLKAVIDNPFRVLGVYSNAKPAEIVSNCDDMEAYLSIGQSVSFELDLNNLMPELERSADSIDNAKKRINLPTDKLKYALFWFFKDSSSEHAMNHLKNGDFGSANSVFEIEDSFSTRINQSVVALMQNNLGTAISRMSEMIHDGDYRDAFVKAICGTTFTLGEDEMAHLYIDTLLEEIPASTLMESFQENGVSEEDNIYLKEKAVDEPISRINTEISKAKSVARDNADANYRAGKALMKNTKNDLAKVKNMLGASDMRYQMLADDLANAILQCGINYYNNNDEDEIDSVNKAWELQEYACTIAKGKLCQDRCKNNLAVLQRKKDELPPKEVAYHDKFIKKALEQYVREPNEIRYAIDLIKETVPYLMSIKEELGSTNTYYLKISTLIANAALHNVIAEFNRIMSDNLRFEMLLDRTGTMQRVRNVFDKAWKATLYMDKLDMEPDFRDGRYKQNRNALKQQVEKIIDVYQTVDLDMRGETKRFRDCRTRAHFANFNQMFPNGKYTSQVEEKVEKLEFNACKTTQDCDAFSRKYPDSKYPILEKREECFYKVCTSVTQYKEYLQKYPHGKYRDQAQQIVNDEEMWSRCVNADSKDEYRKYLSHYPNGRHKTEAEKKVSACYIATMVYGDYDHPQVITLREFRDNTLQNHSIGREIIGFYYKHSPQWVEKMQGKRIANKIIRFLLDKFIILYKYVKK